MIINFLGVCDSSNSLSVIYLLKTGLSLITSIIVPAILILMLSIEIGKIVLGKEENINKNIKGVVTKIIGAVLVYFVPTFVNILFSLMEVSNASIVNCYNNATADHIEYLSSVEKADREFAKQQREKEKNNAKIEREKLEKEREKVRQENEKTAEEKRKEQAAAAKAAIGDPDTGNKSGPITTNEIVYIKVNDLAIPLYYSDHKTTFSVVGVNKQIQTQMHNILYNISLYVKNNSDLMPRFETAGFYVNKAGYHGRGLAVDLFNKWSYQKNGKTYTPYDGQGTWTWNQYKKFICEVCNGQENCEYNINYIIFEKYFKGNGWCWGGNWGPGSFDPMHYELRDGACLTSNKQTVKCN